MPSGPSLGLLELESLARGVLVADVLVKKAAVQIVRAEAVSPGKYLLIFLGSVADVEESFNAGVEAAGSTLIDRLILPHVAEAVRDALVTPPNRASTASIGIVELHTVAATLRAADLCLKKAQVRLTQFELAIGIGGKGWFMICGEQHDVEAALEAVVLSTEANLLVGTELIQQPHHEIRGPIV